MDLISRQAAIDALDKRFDSIPMEQTVEVLQLRRDLRALPPAQPSSKDPIEREAVVDILHDAMQGCSESEEGLIGDIVSKVDLLPSAQPEQKWIPCSDPSDLPKDKRLWITREISDGFFTLREVSDVIWDMTEWSYDVSGVVAYMPYWEPEPYTERREE